MADQPKFHTQFSGTPLQPSSETGPPAAPAGKRRRWPIKSAIALLVIAVIGWLSGTYYYNFFLGPFPYDDDALLAAAERPGDGLLAYVKLTDHPLVPTGIEQVMTTNGRKTSSNPYMITTVGDKLMLVMTDSTVKPGEIVGPIYAVPDDVRAEVIGKLVANNPAAGERFLPIMLNAAAAYTVIGYIGLVFLVPLALICLINIARGAARRG